MQSPLRPDFSLSVQYGTDAPELPRWRLRGWVRSALNHVYQWVEPDAERVELSLRIVDADEGLELNSQFREKAYATNVLTFEYGIDPEGTLRADIVLCYPVLLDEARQQGKLVRHHAAHLTIHGVLHALGYDHLDDIQAHEMESLETRLLAQLKIPDPYGT